MTSPPSKPPETILDFIQVTTRFFQDHGVEDARLETELLLAHALHISQRIQLYVDYEKPLSPDEITRFRELVKRRARHEPVHYILGHREFRDLDLEVQKGVLIPRSDTEALIEEALEFIEKSQITTPRIAEVGIGSGAIAISLLKELGGAEVFASDLMEAPLALSQKNAEKHGVEERLHLYQGQALLPLLEHGPFDLIVSNPPYIKDQDFQALPPHIQLWEPQEALSSGPDGLDCIRMILKDLGGESLRPGGALFLEIGYKEQSDSLMTLLEGSFLELRLRHDYSQLPRVFCALGFIKSGHQSDSEQVNLT